MYIYNQQPHLKSAIEVLECQQLVIPHISYDPHPNKNQLFTHCNDPHPNLTPAQPVSESSSPSDPSTYCDSVLYFLGISLNIYQ